VGLQTIHNVSPDSVTQRLVYDAEHWNDILILGLRNELRENADIVERTLCVCHAHNAVEEIDFTSFA
jgi:hypothetical protein